MGGGKLSNLGQKDRSVSVKLFYYSTISNTLFNPCLGNARGGGLRPQYFSSASPLKGVNILI